MKCQKASRSLHRLSKVAVLLLLAVSVSADAGALADQVNDARGRLQYLFNHLSAADRATLMQTLAELNGKAGELDQLESQLASKKLDVTTAQSAFDSANTAAVTLRQQATAAGQDGDSRLGALVQQAWNICGQMSGKREGTTCVFSCPQDHQEQCSQSMAAFDNQMSPIRSQIGQIRETIRDADENATTAETSASEKQTALQDAKSALAVFADQVAPKLRDFQGQLQSFNKILATAEKSPLTFRLGSAFRQAQAILDQLTKDEVPCYDRGCFDVGANSDGTLVVAPAPALPSPARTDKLDALQTEMEQLASQYNGVHEKLEQAKINNDPAVGDLVRQLSSIQGKVNMQAYRLKTYRISLDVSSH